MLTLVGSNPSPRKSETGRCSTVRTGVRTRKRTKTVRRLNDDSQVKHTRLGILLANTLNQCVRLNDDSHTPHSYAPSKHTFYSALGTIEHQAGGATSSSSARLPAFHPFTDGQAVQFFTPFCRSDRLLEEVYGSITARTITNHAHPQSARAEEQTNLIHAHPFECDIMSTSDM